MDFNGTLDNGIELYTCLNPNLQTFALGLWVRRGAMHEPERLHGLAHALEHVTFRCISERMNGRLYPTLARRALSFDASTFGGYVRFEMTGARDSLDEALDILLMALLPPELSLEGLELERRRIQAEIREDDAEESADHFAHSRVWLGTPLARTIAGSRNSVNRIGFQALRELHGQWFSRGGFFFCATGAVDLDGLIRRLSTLPAPAPAAPLDGCAMVPESFFRRSAAVESGERGFTWLRFCFDVDTAAHSEMALTLLEEALLSDFGTLYLALSEDTGLAYGVNGYFEIYQNIGSLSFDFEVDGRDALPAAQVAVAALRDVCRMGDRGWNALKEGFVRAERGMLDAPESLMRYWGFENGMRHCGFQSLPERLEAYLAVPPDELRALAREVFTPKNALLCALGGRRLPVDALREKVLGLGE